MSNVNDFEMRNVYVCSFLLLSSFYHFYFLNLYSLFFLLFFLERSSFVRSHYFELTTCLTLSFSVHLIGGKRRRKLWVGEFSVFFHSVERSLRSFKVSKFQSSKFQTLRHFNQRKFPHQKLLNNCNVQTDVFRFCTEKFHSWRKQEAATFTQVSINFNNCRSGCP